MQDQNRGEQTTDEQRERVIKDLEEKKLEHIGKPGIESASGRDRSKGELPSSFGTDEGTLDLSRVAPPPGAIEGTRIGPQGDPTGADGPDDGPPPSAKP